MKREMIGLWTPTTRKIILTLFWDRINLETNYLSAWRCPSLQNSTFGNFGRMWGVPLRCHIEMSHWDASLGCPVGMPYWDVPKVFLKMCSRKLFRENGSGKTWSGKTLPEKQFQKNAFRKIVPENWSGKLFRETRSRKSVPGNSSGKRIGEKISG